MQLDPNHCSCSELCNMHVVLSSLQWVVLWSFNCAKHQSGSACHGKSSKAAILTLWHTRLHVTKGRSISAYTSTFCGLEAVKHNTLKTTDGNAHKLPQNQLALFTLLTYRPDTQRWRSHTLQALRELAPSLSHYRPIWSTKKVVNKCLTQASSSQTYASPDCKWTHLPEKFQFLQHQCTVRTISPYITCCHTFVMPNG